MPGKAPYLYGGALTPARFVLALALSGDMLKSLPELPRLLLGFPRALPAGLILPKGIVFPANLLNTSLNGGADAHLWGTASPLQDNEGNVYGAIESLRDATDRGLTAEGWGWRTEEKPYILFVPG